MKNKKGIYFGGLIAFVLIIALFKQFDFENLKFDKPALAIIYIIVLVISVFFVVKDLIKKPEK